MASIAGSYNPDAEPSSGFSLLPDDTYTLEIVESSYDANQDGDGMSLSLKAQVVGGEYDQRIYYIWMDLEHDDDKRQERGQSDFAALRRAVGVLNPQDTEELHFKPFQVKIGQYTSRKTGKTNNTVKEYIFDRGAAAPAQRQPSNDNRQAAAAAPAKAKPWSKK
ncbi:DUF669 domain-containing protein [Bosea sp. NPDC055332]